MHYCTTMNRMRASITVTPVAVPSWKVCLRAHASVSLLSYQAVRSNRSMNERLGNLCVKMSQGTASEIDVDAVDVELKITGMTCEHCSSRVHEALEVLQKVRYVEVSLDSGIAKVQVDAPSYFDAWNQLPQLVDTVTALGFEAEPHFSTADEE